MCAPNVIGSIAVLICPRCVHVEVLGFSLCFLLLQNLLVLSTHIENDPSAGSEWFGSRA